ncbi:MAG: c-type cytochrome biogenesis protein CcmI [Burkholderiaceae bacterium]|nr:c-type cytochrome biogenesis protein CcmI [Burkholderiaceae bacterium]
MTAFVLVAVAMVLAAVAWVMWPLLRRGAAPTVNHSAANVSIFKDQFADLDADLVRGTISSDQHAEARSELERRLLDDAHVDAPSDSTIASRNHNRWSAVAVALIAPVVAAALYWQVGTPAALTASSTQAAQQDPPTREQIEAMVVQLTQRLGKEPDNAEGWALLARTQYSIGNFDAAVAAFQKLSVLLPDNAGLMADYADALAMSQGRSFAGEPMVLVRRALTIDPTQWKALAMAGAEAFDRKDYSAAIGFWQRLQKTTPPDSPITVQLQGSIDRARELAGIAPSAPVAALPKRDDAAVSNTRSVSGTVALSASLTSKVRPDDSVFVFARPADGSRMPVAVVRARVSELPLQFTLDDSRAMAPTAKISNLAEVIVSARVSRTGNALPASGDLEGTPATVKVGSRGLALIIDRSIP